MNGVSLELQFWGLLNWTSKGKIGNDSAAAKFAAATPSDGFKIAEDKPYAEVCLQYY